MEDTDIQKLVQNMKEWQSEMETYAYPSKTFCMEVASKLPNRNLEELLDNCEKISEYLKRRI